MWRLEKEENGKQAIILDDWSGGISDDPYSGPYFATGVNLETPGEASVGYPITISTRSGGSLSRPIARSTRFFSYATPGIPSGSAQSFAILDDTGEVFESSSITGTWTFLSSGNSGVGSSNLDGLCYWLGYLFKTRGANIDYWDGSTWHTAWQTTLTANTKHFMYVATDNVLYITNGNFLASITANSPTAFDPANSGTYVFNNNKLQLPVTDISLSLAEVGTGSTGSQTTLLIGGQQNAIYPWDKTSVSFGVPIYVADAYIKNMVSANQTAFIFPGNQQGRGRIYITNGSQASLFYKVPDYITGEIDPYFVWGDAIFHRGNLVFNFEATHNNGSGGIPVDASRCVWAIDLTTKQFRSISAFPVATTIALANCLLSTSSLSSPGFGYIAAWTDGATTPNIGYSGTTAGIGSTLIYTDMIPVGTFLTKSTPSEIEFKLRSPMISGESLTITPIVDGVTGTDLTFNPTPTIGSISGYAPATFIGAQWLQFKIVLTGNGVTSGMRFFQLRVRQN